MLWDEKKSEKVSLALPALRNYHKKLQKLLRKVYEQ